MYMQSWKLFGLGAMLALVFCLGFGAGYMVFRPEQGQRTEVTSQVILTALRERGFLVTQTYLFDQPVVIRRESGNFFDDLLFGQKITARGVMEVNLGVDLSQVGLTDVQMSEEKVRISIPGVTLFNVRLVGPLDVQNDRGILKRILERDAGYNEAQAELARVAEEQARSSVFVERAQQKAAEEIARLVQFFAEGKSVEVMKK